MGCAAYIATEFMLTRAIFEDELGPLAKDYVGSTFSWQGLIARLKIPPAHGGTTPRQRGWSRRGT